LRNLLPEDFGASYMLLPYAHWIAGVS
jgi:hypothetical protein